MDYEKAYKEAVERAKLFQEKYGGDYAGYIFPELAESEDEKTAREIKEFILYKAGHLLDEATEHRFITYLEKQKEQKPTEWSEEDENAITTAIRACRYMTENFENSTKQYEDAIERLKSIRPQPHWKPSEEQMETLKSCFHINPATGKSHSPSLDEIYMLSSLYNDLKKL